VSSPGYLVVLARLSARGPVMSILKDLRNISRREASVEDMAEFSRQVELESNDRGAALLVGTNADLALTQAIYSALQVGDDIKDLLERQGSPLETFSQRITMGRALRIYGETTEYNLTLLRHIRNAFAHAHVPITFETAEVSAAVSLFRPITLMHPHTVGADTKPIPDTSRGKFHHHCETLSHNLIVWAWLSGGAPPNAPTGYVGVLKHEQMA
jgi:hypothetical protein